MPKPLKPVLEPGRIMDLKVRNNRLVMTMERAVVLIRVLPR